MPSRLPAIINHFWWCVAATAFVLAIADRRGPWTLLFVVAWFVMLATMVGQSLTVVRNDGSGLRNLTASAPGSNEFPSP